MIELKDLRKSYDGHEVLKGIHLNLARGRITGVAGPNGCGKTTLTRCILGLAVPEKGEIHIDGKPVDPQGSFRKQIGYMPQNPSFPANLSLQELMEMLEDLRRQKATEKDHLIDHFRLKSILTQPFGQLSGGTKQKVAALAAFMFDAPLIICDEPTAGLDPVSRVRFKDLLRFKAQAGKTIILVSHFMGEIEQLAAELVFMAEGQVLFAGPLQDLRERTGETDLERAVTCLFGAQDRGMTK